MRKRDHSIIVRLNGSELHHLKEQVEKTGLSREVYLRKLIMCKEVRERPHRDCVELLQEVRSQSRLLNAIAQDALNQGFVDERQVNRLLDGVESAWDEMKETKERWGKHSGIEGFHVVQSFAPGEVEPELAHRIGVEFVQRCFPDYQAVIGTHLDKHHIHNHIVLNSVSYMDGHKYHSSKKSYYNELRKTSDELCRKYGLSVIDGGTRVPSSRHYSEWKADRQGQPTWCSAIRDDVDAAVASSVSFEQFIRQMRSMGYEVKTEVKHIAVRPPGKERFTRLRRLGENYTEEELRRRIQENASKGIPQPQQYQTGGHASHRSHGTFRGSWRRSRKSKVGGLRGLYLWYAFKMGVVKKSGSTSRRTHYLLREDIRKLDKRERMASLLVKNRIETMDQLHAHQDECRELISVLCDERAQLKRQEATEEVTARLEAIGGQLQFLRREMRTCKEIETDSVELQQKRDALRRIEQKKPNDDLNGKVIVIRADVLRREYRSATNQVMLCTGGFGASPRSRGSACYCVELYSGQRCRYERQDVLGILNPDQQPKWVKHHLEVQQQKQKKKSSRGEER